MHKIKITAIRKADYKDLQQKYENPIQHACDIQEGQVFIANGWQRPEGMRISMGKHFSFCDDTGTRRRKHLRWVDTLCAECAQVNNFHECKRSVATYEESKKCDDKLQ